MEKIMNKIEFIRSVQVKLPSKFGKFDLIAYESPVTQMFHLALVKGDVSGKSDVVMRIHSSCITGDIFGSLRCDCREQLIGAAEYIEKVGTGVVIYAFQEGRGIGLINKLKAYYLQEGGLDTVEANLALGLPEDSRNYDFVKFILDDLKIQSVVLITNNPDKQTQLENLGVNVSGILQSVVTPCEHNLKYLQTKKYKMNHLLEGV